MVSPSRTPAGVDRLRALNRPRRLSVRTDAAERPVAVYRSLSRRRQEGRWVKVTGVLDVWRVDEAWWRSYPIRRLYYRIVLASGAMLDVYRDLVNGYWFEQRYDP